MKFFYKVPPSHILRVHEADDVIVYNDRHLQPSRDCEPVVYEGVKHCTSVIKHWIAKFGIINVGDLS